MLRFLVSSLFTAIYLAVDRLRGYRQFKETGICKNGTNTFIISSAEGYRLTVFVTKEEYTEHYPKISKPANRHYLYTVRAEVSRDAPAYLKRAIAKEMSFPPLLPRFMADKIQLDRVLKSYMDIIGSRVAHNKRVASDEL